MLNLQDKQKCCGCSACASICPKNCISLITDKEGFLYPQVNAEQCVNCGACQKVCPYNSKPNTLQQKDAFAVVSNNQQQRLNSSSGGVFCLLATKVIQKGGVVFGACLDDDLVVKHIFVQSLEQINKLQGSKYVQSDINNTYLQAKTFLEQDKIVLFTGTSCQIAGLKAYLKKDYQNLITQDIICHGVPSPKVWKEYLKYRSGIAKSTVNKTCFRDKNKGWKKYSIAHSFENGKKLSIPIYSDPYMRLFLKNLSLRPSCYSCNFNGENRLSDITLADFWGIEKVDASMDDDKGTSLVVINTKKGQTLFEEIAQEVTLKQVDFESAIKYNPSYSVSAPQPQQRNAFMDMLDKKGFESAYNKFAKETFSAKIKKLIKKLFRR